MSMNLGSKKRIESPASDFWENGFWKLFVSKWKLNGAQYHDGIILVTNFIKESPLFNEAINILSHSNLIKFA